MTEAQPTPATPSPPPQRNLEGTQDERTWALFTHLSALSSFVIGIGLVVGPLVVWLLGKDRSSFIDRHGKEALNFGITVAIVALACVVLGFGLMILTFGFAMFLVFPLVFALLVAWVVLVIMAAIKAHNGEDYQYPVNIRFIR